MKLILHGVFVCWLLMSVSLSHVQAQTAPKTGCGFPNDGERYFISAMVSEVILIGISPPNSIGLLNAVTFGNGRVAASLPPVVCRSTEPRHVPASGGTTRRVNLVNQ